MAILFELGIFLVVLAFGLWQLHDVKKAIREREQRAASTRSAPPGPTDNNH